MARRNIPMIEVEEILYRWLKGISVRRIARSLRISRNTVKRIILQAQGIGLNQASSQKELEQARELLYSVRHNNNKVLGPAQTHLAQYHEQIETWLSMPHMTVTQMVRLFAEGNIKISESSLRRYIRNNFPSLPDSTVHLETIPGHQAQVDFGAAGLMRDPVTQVTRKVYVFIMTLSHSRYRFVRFVFKQNVKTWIDCHIRAFHFYGGIPETVMFDSLKAGVQKSDIYDPIFNRAYGELEKHYGFVCDPTKVRTPRHKE